MQKICKKLTIKIIQKDYYKKMSKFNLLFISAQK